MNKHSLLLLILICCSSIFTSLAQETPQKLPDKTRILLLLDASGSMLAKWENTYRINVAKKLLTDLVDSLRVNENLELALRVYGHQFDRKYKRCNDSKLEVGFGQGNHDRIITRLNALQPKGTTPIAYSLEQAANDFPMDKNYRNIIIIITDGIESCDGDPCAVSLALQKKSIFLKPFIIGIGMEKDYQDAFGCIGRFYDADNIAEFKDALRSAVTTSVEKTTVSVELLDAQGNKNETNVNVSFINSFTGLSAFEFVHYRDAQGRPDSVDVETVLTYDVIVNTVPPVVKKDVNFKPGKHNILPIKSPQGALSIDLPGHFEYEKGVQLLVKDPANQQIITTSTLPQSVLLLEGTYDVEVLTLPRRRFRNVSIKKEKPLTFTLKKPGIINFTCIIGGYGSIYQLSESGTQRWVTNLNSELRRQTITMQPGKYKIVFRSKRSLGSKYTKIREITLNPGQTINIQF